MSAQYPGAAGTDANLFVAVNNLSTSLSDNPLTSGATTVNVASTTGFPTAGYITIEAEAISYTGTTSTSFTGCTRGADGTAAASHVTGLTVFHDAVAAHHNVLKDEIKAVEADLVAVMAAITPVTAASTASSALQRIAHIVSQIKNGFGLTNWYDTVTAMLPKTGGTMSGNIAMGSNKVTGLANGSASGDAAALGQVKVLQTVTASVLTSTSTTSSSYQTTSFTASITPTSSSSKIVVLIFAGYSLTNGTAGSGGIIYTIFRGASDLGGSQGFGFRLIPVASQNLVWPVAFGTTDSPATTSSVTYTLKIKSVDGSSTASIGDTNTGGQVILMEIQ